MNLGIRFQGGQQSTMLETYADADYANDLITRKSVSGYVTKLFDGPISWRSQRQSIIALSTTEAEYISGCEAVKNLVPIRAHLLELEAIKEEPSPVYIDNQSAVKLAANENCAQRTRHISIRQKWLTEKQEEKQIIVQHIPGIRQQADMLTKALSKDKFITNRSMLMAFTTLLALTIVNAEPMITFKRTNPVFYKESDIVAFSGSRRWFVRSTFVNPCTIYFKDITGDEVINNRLIRDCNIEFSNSFNFKNTCRKLDNPINVVELDMMHRRSKRMIQAVLGIATSVLGGGQVYTTVKLNALEEEIDNLRKAINEKNELLQQTTISLKIIRDTIKSVDGRLDEIERRLNFINNTVQSFPKIMALMLQYEREFQNYKLNIEKINRAADDKLMSPALMELLKNPLWREPASKWSRLHKCAYALDSKGQHFEMSFWFTIPIKTEYTKILEAESFRIWNKTETGANCLVRYIGPKYIITNSTSDCFSEIEKHFIENEAVQSHVCVEPHKRVNSNRILFEAAECHESPNYPKTIDVKEVGENNLVYCFGNNITVRQSQTPCPLYVFKLSLSESFTINDIDYNVIENAEVVVSPLVNHLNDQITGQLKVSDIVIKSTNFTEADSKLTSISKLVTDFTKNLTKIDTSDFPDFGFKSFLNGLSEVVQTILIVIGTVCVIAFILLCPPILHGLIFVIRIMKRLVLTMITNIKSSTGWTTRSRRLRDKFKHRLYP